MAERQTSAGRPPREIQARTYEFALRVLRLARVLPQVDLAGRVIARQVAKSGTSIGANVAEAQGALSRADFARRIGVARGEAYETLFWLRLIADLELVPRHRMQDILIEADEIVRVLKAIARRARSTKDQPANTRKSSKKTIPS
jgi:four helix bundle protein